MGNQIITQPQTFKTNTVVIGSTAGLSAVSGLTVYGDISATGGVYGSTVGGTVLMQNVITGTGASSYTLTNYTNDVATNYLVFLDGVKQRATTDYSINGSQITFTSAVQTGTVIEVDVAQSIASISGGTVNSVGITSDGTITASNSPITTSGNISLSITSVPLSTVGNSLTFPSSGNITTYTLALSDNNNLLCVTAGTSGVVAISPTIPYPVGYQTGVLQLSSGQITLSAGVGIILSNEASATKTARQFGAATLVNLGSRWVSYGSLV